MSTKHLLPFLAAAGLAGALAPTAGASTICVPSFHPACPAGSGNIERTTLTAALATGAGDGTADVIRIAPGVLSEPATIKAPDLGTDPVTIEGAGRDQTVVTTSSAANAYVLDLNPGARKATLRDLDVRVPDTAPDNAGAGLQLAHQATLERVDITIANPGSAGSDAINSIVGYARLHDVRVHAIGSGKVGYGVRIGNTAGQVDIDGLRVDAPHSSGLAASGPGNNVSAYRVEVTSPAQTAVSVSAGNVTVEDVLVTDAALPFAVVASSSYAALTVRQATVTYAGALNAAPFLVQTTGSAPAGITATDTVATGYTSAFVRSGQSGGGTADLDLYFSALPAVAGLEAGPGAVSKQDVITADPLLGADHRPLPGSPVIDAGDPEPDGYPLDLAGAPRRQDGNGDGVVRRDMGAFEVAPPVAGPQPGPGADAQPQPQPQPGPRPQTDPQPQPTPDTTAPDTTVRRTSQAKLLEQGRATFVFTSTEKVRRFECSLDGRAFRSCGASRKTIKGLRRGRHVLRVRAVDLAGNVDRTPATVSFRARRPR